ncbi:hypothetical protein FKM82_017439 [Ascaphus truei]
MDSAFKNSSISSKYAGCHIDSFRPGTSASQTNVNSICTIRKAVTGPQFDRVTFYNEIREKTKNITQLGVYKLDQNSLYVNGYNEKIPSTAAPFVEPPIQAVTKHPVEASNIEDITLNFTITNLPFTSDLGTKSSIKFNTTTAVILSLLTSAFKNSTINSKYISCRIYSFVPKVSDTTVNSICNIKKDTMGSPFDKVAFYKEIEDMTKNITKWGIYNLDKNSLYVNGYNKVSTDIITTAKPTTKITPIQSFGPRQFLLNFTITNLNHSRNLENTSSSQFISQKKILDYLLNNLFKNSNIKSYFSSCNVTGFRPTPPTNYTTAESVCTFNVDILAKVFSEDDIYNAFINMTQGGKSMDNYTLDKDSIHVDNFRQEEITSPITSTSTITTTTMQAIAHPVDRGFDVGFTIINGFVPSDSESYKKLEKSIEDEVGLHCQMVAENGAGSLAHRPQDIFGLLHDYIYLLL